MRFFNTCTLVVLPTSIYGWKPFSPSAEAPGIFNSKLRVSAGLSGWSNPSVGISKATESIVEINPSVLLDSRPRKPGFYADAMLEVKRLEEKPICHQIAAQLLMSNCQGIEDISKGKYQDASAAMQRHHVESFAAGLAMCDMERAGFDIPDDCAPFRSGALDRAIRGTGKIEVSPENISACLKGLGRDHSHWNTWLSYRDTALLLCRGARVEVDKDHLINLQKQLIHVMEEFTTGLYDDLKALRDEMVSASREFGSVFEKAKYQAEDWMVKIHEAFESVSVDLKDANSIVNSVVSGANDAYRMMRNLVNTMIQTNAEMAAVQENVLAVTTKNFQTRIGGINELVTVVEVNLAGMQDRVGEMFTMIHALSDRQDTIEETSKNALNTLINATELLQSHTQKLDKASATVSAIDEGLKRVAATVLGLHSRGSGLDWVLRGFVPIFTLVGGNFKTASTAGNNLLLLSFGLGIAEAINMYRHWDWIWNCVWSMPQLFSKEPVSEPSAFTHRVTTWKAELPGVNAEAEEQLSPTPMSEIDRDIHAEIV